MKWLESLHEDAKYMLAGILGAMGPIVISLVTGVAEFIFREEMPTCLLAGILSLGCLGGLLVLEFYKLQPKNHFIWASVFFGSAVFGSIMSYILVGVYVEYIYTSIYPGEGSFLAGIQWVFYLAIVYGAEVLWILIRTIIGIVRFHDSRKKQKKQSNLVYRNGV